MKNVVLKRFNQLSACLMNKLDKWNYALHKMFQVIHRAEAHFY